MGFGVSHQKAGLNWAGRYKEWCRERALADSRKGRYPQITQINADEGKGTPHAKWRRITGITTAVEGVLTTKERKKGLKRLVERIKDFTTERTENTEKRQEGKEPTLMQPWGIEVEKWAGGAGNSIESLCVELEISRARLTMLTKEYCGLTAQELVDGFKIRRAKRGLIERLREAAERLWGIPGSFAAWKYEGFREPPRRQGRQEGQGFRAEKRSRYFWMRPEEYAAEERGAERARRSEELAAELRRNFDAEDWAARMGFASAARLKRACLNVLGRSLRALERALAAEVVRYYLCAEDKVLREVACADGNNPNVIRARWVYNESEDAPTEPFLDEWSKAEALARDWLDRMRAAFGCT